MTFTEAELRNIATVFSDYSKIVDVVSNVIPGFRPLALKQDLLTLGLKAEKWADEEAKKTRSSTANK